MPEVFNPQRGGEAAWYQFLGTLGGRYGTPGWWPGPAPYSRWGNLGTTGGIGGGTPPPVRPAQPGPSPADSPHLTAEQLTSLYMRGPVRGLQRTHLELLRWELENRLRTNPGDDFARLMLREIGQRTRRSSGIPGPYRRVQPPKPIQPPKPVREPSKAAKSAAARLAARLVARFLPGPWQIPVNVGEIAQAITGDLAAAQLRTMEAALGRVTFPGFKPPAAVSSAPSSRGRKPRGRTTTTRAARLAPLPVPRVVPAAEAAPELLVRPASELAPLSAIPGEPQKATRTQSGAKPARPAARAVGKRRSLASFAWAHASPGLATFSDPTGARARLLDSPHALTGTESPVQESGQPGCECGPGKKPKQQKKRKKKPRSVCYSGTYTERASGLSKRKKRKVPCR